MGIQQGPPMEPGRVCFSHLLAPTKQGLLLPSCYPYECPWLTAVPIPLPLPHCSQALTTQMVPRGGSRCSTAHPSEVRLPLTAMGSLRLWPALAYCPGLLLPVPAAVPGATLLGHASLAQPTLCTTGPKHFDAPTATIWKHLGSEHLGAVGLGYQGRDLHRASRQAAVVLALLGAKRQLGQTPGWPRLHPPSTFHPILLSLPTSLPLALPATRLPSPSPSLPLPCRANQQAL